MAEVIEAQMLEASDEYLEGYEEALLYIQTLLAGLDLQPYKLYMRVEGGHLVDLIEGTRARTLREIPKVGRAGEGVADNVEPLAKLG